VRSPNTAPKDFLEGHHSPESRMIFQDKKCALVYTYDLRISRQLRQVIIQDKQLVSIGD
jgi:hypothetical protein